LCNLIAALVIFTGEHLQRREKAVEIARLL
jgi:hypothetical protein